MSALPIETALQVGWYICSDGEARHLNYVGDIEELTKVSAKPQIRLEPVAEYRPAPAEPTGLGAVARGSDGQLWVRTHYSAHWPWRKANSGVEIHWHDLANNYQPVEVLSQGVTL